MGALPARRRLLPTIRTDPTRISFVLFSLLAKHWMLHDRKESTICSATAQDPCGVGAKAAGLQKAIPSTCRTGV